MVLSAERGPGAPRWEDEWVGGGRAVHLGNVADFNAQFTDDRPSSQSSKSSQSSRSSRSPRSSLSSRSSASREALWGSGHHYACLAPFYSPHPAVVVLPLQVEDAWLGLISRRLEWDRVELYSGIVGERGWFAEALAARPALLNRLRGTGLPLLPWGRTPEYERLAGCAGDGVLGAVRRFESKARAAELFHEVAASHPGIEAHEQQRVDSVRRLGRLVAARAAKGETVVLKSEFGVGGAGTVIAAPGRVAAAEIGRASCRERVC